MAEVVDVGEAAEAGVGAFASDSEPREGSEDTESSRPRAAEESQWRASAAAAVAAGGPSATAPAGAHAPLAHHTLAGPHGHGYSHEPRALHAAVRARAVAAAYREWELTRDARRRMDSAVQAMDGERARPASPGAGRVAGVRRRGTGPPGHLPSPIGTSTSSPTQRPRGVVLSPHSAKPSQPRAPPQHQRGTWQRGRQPAHPPLDTDLRSLPATAPVRVAGIVFSDRLRRIRSIRVDPGAHTGTGTGVGTSNGTGTSTSTSARALASLSRGVGEGGLARAASLMAGVVPASSTEGGGFAAARARGPPEGTFGFRSPRARRRVDLVAGAASVGPAAAAGGTAERKRAPPLSDVGRVLSRAAVHQHVRAFGSGGDGSATDLAAHTDADALSASGVSRGAGLSVRTVHVRTAELKGPTRRCGLCERRFPTRSLVDHAVSRKTVHDIRASWGYGDPAALLARWPAATISRTSAYHIYQAVPLCCMCMELGQSFLSDAIAVEREQQVAEERRRLQAVESAAGICE